MEIEFQYEEIEFLKLEFHLELKKKKRRHIVTHVFLHETRVFDSSFTFETRIHESQVPNDASYLTNMFYFRSHN